MHWYNKVVWSEGLFLRPQLFQQQERYLERYAHRRAAFSGPFFWGFRNCEIDATALALGMLVVARAEGLFKDGTPFEAPGEITLPAPFAVRQEHVGQLLSLAVPARTANGEEVTFDAADVQKSSLARFSVVDVELRDSNSVGQGTHPVQLSQMRLRVMPAGECNDNWIGMPIVRVVSVGNDGTVVLDPAYVPPACGIGASAPLLGRLGTLHGICSQRAAALAARLSASDGRAHESAEVADFLVLQILNRSEAVLQHLLKVADTPPEQIYLCLRALDAELSTFVRTDSRRPPAHAPYRHDNLEGCFQPLMAHVQALLNGVLVRSACQIPLTARGDGMLVASVEPSELKSFSSVVFAVASDMPAEKLASDFVAQCKVGPVDQLPGLIRAHLPGIALQSLPVPPRQIPFNAGYVYFQLDQGGPLWTHTLTHGGIALHLAGVFPGLRLELWGISRK